MTRLYYEDGAPKTREAFIRIRTARKEYQCQLCAGIITPGQQYVAEGIVEDGNLAIRRNHIVFACRSTIDA